MTTVNLERYSVDPGWGESGTEYPFTTQTNLKRKTLHSPQNWSYSMCFLTCHPGFQKWRCFCLTPDIRDSFQSSMLACLAPNAVTSCHFILVLLKNKWKPDLEPKGSLLAYWVISNWTDNNKSFALLCLMDMSLTAAPCFLATTMESDKDVFVALQVIEEQ
jgi:hypothetical protein